MIQYQHKIQSIMQTLQNVPGLTVIDLLHEQHKLFIQQLESNNNFGVHQAIQRKHTLLVSHDSSFREPAGTIVEHIKDRGQVIFPAVSFPELNTIANNIVSSSPSKKVHEALQKTLNIKLPAGEATLLIGFNLK